MRGHTSSTFDYPFTPSRSEHRTLLARLLILEVLFDGDPASWRDWLLTHGSDAQRAEDLPFVEMLCRKAMRTPGVARSDA